MKLWLDDDREPPTGWNWVKTAHEALRLIRSGEVTEASLDHDLGLAQEPHHGYWLLCQIEADLALGAKYSVPNFVIHSWNSAGLKNMRAALASIERLRASGVRGRNEEMA